MPSVLEYFAHPHAPNLSLLNHVTPVIVIHLCAALIAFGIGAIQILGPKGTTMHRILGWTWVVIMAVVAGSSFFIRVINHGGFSLIHILSLVTLVALPIGVYGARKGNIKLHKGVMTRLYLFALIVAGLFTFFPGRLMYQMVFG